MRYRTTSSATQAAMDASSVPYMTVVALRKELRARGQEARGNKAALVDRLTTLLSQEEPASSPKAPQSPLAESRSPAAPVVDKQIRKDTSQPKPRAAARPRSPQPARESEPKPAAAGDADSVSAAPVDADDHPLSEERMRRRAKRFGMPWPPVEKDSTAGASGAKGATRNAKRQSRSGRKKEPAIGGLDASDDEMARRAKRAKRFGVK